MKLLDSAIYWMEFAMRHRGAARLWTASYRMAWYVYRSVDAIVVLLALLTTVVMSKYCCCRLCWKSKVKSD